MRILVSLLACLAATAGLADSALAAPVAQAADPFISQADAGDTAWMLAATALVLLALPGLAFYYGGAVRYKNGISIPLQIGVIAAVVSLLWVIVGYTLAFAETSGGWLGGGSRWMLLSLDATRYGTLIPESAFALFQIMLAILAASLMVGAWAERARFGWVVIFAGLWCLLVYAPIVHWLWGGGWLAQRIGTIDFAGGLVIHATAGISALVVALMMGRRRGFPEEADDPQSDYLRLLGIPLLWLGMFGVNGGMALAATDDTAAALINMQVAAAAAILMWHFMDRVRAGQVNANGFASGALAGLIAISPAAAFVSPGAAMIIGLVAAPVCYMAAKYIRNTLQVDDALGVFAINGVGGMIGAVLLAVLLSPQWGGVGYPEGVSMVAQFAAQLIGVAVVLLWSILVTALLATAVSLFVPMRVGEDEEDRGLDAAHHG